MDVAGYFEGVKVRTRPVVMTALMASIGLLPAAFLQELVQNLKTFSNSNYWRIAIGYILTLLIFPIIFGFSIEQKMKISLVDVVLKIFDFLIFFKNIKKKL
jgi:cobalt-zinc-cadmium resistance protein CzcA